MTRLRRASNPISATKESLTISQVARLFSFVFAINSLVFVIDLLGPGPNYCVGFLSVLDNQIEQMQLLEKRQIVIDIYQKPCYN